MARAFRSTSQRAVALVVATVFSTHAAVAQTIPKTFKDLLLYPGAKPVPVDTADSEEGDLALEGIADNPYDIDNERIEYGRREPGPQVWFWRSVGHSQNIFFIESFIDELAAAAKKDPFEYRRGLLTKQPRYKGVLELAAEKAGWGMAKLPAGVHRASQWRRASAPARPPPGLDPRRRSRTGGAARRSSARCRRGVGGWALGVG